MKSKLKISTNGLVLLIALNFAILPLGGWFIHKNTQTEARLGQVQEGARTCFSRVTQSFTAFMIKNSNSTYLGDDFFSTSEECLSEVGNLVKTLGVSTAKEIQAQVNEFKNELHWLHTYLNRPTDSVNIPNRYEGVEVLKDQIVDALEAEKSRVTKDNQRAWKASIASFALLCLLMAVGLVNRISGHRKNKEWEMAASEYGEAPTDYKPADIESLVMKALEQNGLPTTSATFAKYHSYLIGGKIIPLSHAHEVPAHDEYLGFEKSNLTDILNDILDLTADQVFSKGILFDFDTDDQIYVYADKEALQQMIYNLVTYAIDQSTFSTGKRKVIMRTKVLGASVLFKVSHSGGTIDNGLVKALNRSDSVNAEGVDLRISLCHELISDLHGEMRCKYRRDRDDNISGNMFEFVLHRVEVDDLPLVALESELDINQAVHPNIEAVVDEEDSSKRLVKVVKGKKKDIISQMNA